MVREICAHRSRRVTLLVEFVPDTVDMFTVEQLFLEAFVSWTDLSIRILPLVLVGIMGPGGGFMHALLRLFGAVVWTTEATSSRNSGGVIERCGFNPTSFTSKPRAVLISGIAGCGSTVGGMRRGRGRRLKRSHVSWRSGKQAEQE